MTKFKTKTLLLRLGRRISENKFRHLDQHLKLKLAKQNSFHLENGLKVIVVENHKLPRVSFQVFVDAPEVHQGEMAGFIDIAGQLLSKGTTNRSKAEIDLAVDFMGASLSSSLLLVCLGLALTKHKEGLLDIMSDVLLNPTFPRLGI